MVRVHGVGHRRMLSGDVLWCRKCGCYADSRVMGLAGPCKGKPIDTTGGGRAGQLKYLLAGSRPRTKTMLPPAIDEDYKFPDPYRGPAAVDSNGADLPTLKPYHSDGKSSSDKMKERVERIRALERSRKATCKRLRGKQVPGNEWQP